MIVDCPAIPERLIVLLSIVGLLIIGFIAYLLVLDWFDWKANKNLEDKYETTEGTKKEDRMCLIDEQIRVDKILKYICIQLAKDKGYFEDIKRQLGEWIADGTTDINDPSFREKVDAFLKNLREDN